MYTYIHTYTCIWASLWLIGKETTCNAGAAGDTGLMPGLGRSPEGGHGNPPQYSCQENPKGRGAWWAIVHRVPESDETETTEHTSTYAYVTYFIYKIWTSPAPIKYIPPDIFKLIFSKIVDPSFIYFFIASKCQASENCVEITKEDEVLKDGSNCKMFLDKYSSTEVSCSTHQLKRIIGPPFTEVT